MMMKKLSFILMALIVAGVFVSCNHGQGSLTDAKQQAVAKQYVEHTITPTYKNLAAQTEQLVLDLKQLKENRTQANLNKACETFLEARSWWEKSEAFLYGAASDFGIDPHIDSWPLDADAFQTMMSNTAQILAMDSEDGDVYAGEKLGNSLLGFHGIEYILFAEGAPKNADQLTDLEMIYAVAVAGDLRNRCYQLEVSWIGNEAPANHIAKVEELELNHTVNGSGYSYGDNMLKAGQAGSTYASSVAALMAIVDGCATIADEVGTSKIGKPFHGEDVSYIESPYSHKSIVDFYDNIISIENAYMGGVAGQRDASKSLYHYVSKFDADLADRVAAAITEAEQAIQNMKAPFVSNYTDASAGAAIDACMKLTDVLDELQMELRKQ